MTLNSLQKYSRLLWTKGCKYHHSPNGLLSKPFLWSTISYKNNNFVFFNRTFFLRMEFDQNFSSITRTLCGSNSNQEPKILVLSGPSGSGKSTFVKELLKSYPDKFAFSVSHTTRKPRSGETNGKDYYFLSKEEMLEKIKCGDFIEWTEFNGNYYGTSKSEITRIINNGKICLLDLEFNGVKSLKECKFNASYIFITVPSFEELEARLQKRCSDTPEQIKERVKLATKYIEDVKENNIFDKTVVNDDFKTAYSEFSDYVRLTFPKLRNDQI